MNASDVIKILNLEKNDICNFVEFQLRGISIDSRSMSSDYCFIALAGNNFDGHDFIAKAIDKGARLIIYERGHIQPADYFNCSKNRKVVFVAVNNPRVIAGIIAAEFFKNPDQSLKIIGITGTNGKTTVSFLTEHIFKENGINTGVVGTIHYKIADNVIPAKNTTPDPINLQLLLKQMVDHKLTHAIMEVSSHALDQFRVNGINFQIAVFTNLTHDHLDYHKDKEKYFTAKSSLFKLLNNKSWAVINIDDRYGMRLKKMTSANILDYAIENRKAAVFAEDIKFGLKETRFTVVSPQGKIQVQTKLIGRHNVYNILACVSIGIIENLSLNSIAQAVKTIKFIPGRLERVQNEYPFEIFIDYAHTDDALKNVLSVLRELKPNKIITVFGCGGDRDTAKRPLMGTVASQHSDYLILTNDNPRNEEPESIIEDIKSGFDQSYLNYEVLPDREKAITRAIKLAGAGDFVLIAGKGHETYQIFKDKTTEFDDRKIVREILEIKNKI